MSLEHNFYRTNEICYQGKAGQVHQLKIRSFFSALPVNGPALFKMIDFIISSFIKVLCEAVARAIRTTESDSAWLSTSGTSRFSNSDSSLWVFWPHPFGSPHSGGFLWHLKWNSGKVTFRVLTYLKKHPISTWSGAQMLSACMSVKPLGNDFVHNTVYTAERTWEEFNICPVGDSKQPINETNLS